MFYPNTTPPFCHTTIYQVYMVNKVNGKIENISTPCKSHQELQVFLNNMRPLINRYYFLVNYTTYTPINQQSVHMNYGSYYHNYNPPTSMASAIPVPTTSTHSPEVNEPEVEEPEVEEPEVEEPEVEEPEVEEPEVEESEVEEFITVEEPEVEEPEVEEPEVEEVITVEEQIAKLLSQLADLEVQVVETENTGHNFHFDPPVDTNYQFNSSYQEETRPRKIPKVNNYVDEGGAAPLVENLEWHFLENKEEEEEEGSINTPLMFEGMKMYKHGRGYLLRCPEDHPDWGVKYYPYDDDSKAWWQNCNSGWFLRRENKNYFLDNGAEYVFTEE